MRSFEKALAALVIVLTVGFAAGCGSTDSGFSDTNTGTAPDSFIAACEGDVGSRIEAHCICIENSVSANVSQDQIQSALGEISAGNPPSWYMQAAINCPS